MTMCDDLRHSPMFNLSMASKELFHSNMLYWISQTYREGFLKMLNILHIDTSQWQGEWESHREKDHFDLSVSMNGKYLLVLENKVKSIPYKSQLDEYQEKAEKAEKESKPQYLLLSLCTDFAQKEDMRQEGWKIANYSDLATAIQCIIPSIQDDYHRDMLKDYCFYIEHLHRIQQKWTLKLNENYRSAIVDNDEDIKQLNDVKKKVMVSKMAGYLLEYIEGAKLAGNKEIEIKETEKTDSPKEEIGKVYINFGMTRSTGLIDLKVRVKGNLFQIIQVQGLHFKYCVEVLGEDKEGMEVINSLIQYLSNETNNRELLTHAEARRIIENKFLSHKDESQDESTVFEKSNSKKPFNKYGNTFIYQYVNIKEDVTVGCILDKIIEQVNKIIENLKAK